MAGFVVSSSLIYGYYEFHINEDNLINRIERAAQGRRVVSFQLDGDELVAALWGFENYRSRRKPNCLTCGKEAELWAKDGSGLCCRCIAVSMIENHKDIREAARKALGEPETPVQEQLQYQVITCPNCLKSGGVVDIIDDYGNVPDWAKVPPETATHACRWCGQYFREGDIL